MSDVIELATRLGLCAIKCKDGIGYEVIDSELTAFYEAALQRGKDQERERWVNAARTLQGEVRKIGGK